MSEVAIKAMEGQSYLYEPWWGEQEQERRPDMAGNVTVFRMAEDDNSARHAAAYSIQELLREGYTTIAGQADTAATFDPTNAKHVREQEEKIAAALQSGSQFWFMTLGDTQNPVAFSKISPSQSRAARMLGREPNLFLNETMVTKGLRGRGLGSVLRHTVLEFAGYAPDRKVALHADGPSTQLHEWYKRVGFEPQNTEIPPLVIGRTAVRQQLFVAPSLALVKGNLQELHQRATGRSLRPAQLQT